MAVQSAGGRQFQSDTGDFALPISHTELLEHSNLSALELAPSRHA